MYQNHHAPVCLPFNCLFLVNSAFHICSSAEHGNKTGTNLYSALDRVYELISFFKQNRATNHFNETQNIIIIETDGERKYMHSCYNMRSALYLVCLHLSPILGYSNTGKNPVAALKRIRGVLGYNNAIEDHTDETMLGTVMGQD